MDRSFFRFVTIHAFGRHTDIQTNRIAIDRVCIPCSAVKKVKVK